MKQRSEQERDQCLDVLTAKVKALEQEVALLKGALSAGKDVRMESAVPPDLSGKPVEQLPEHLSEKRKSSRLALEKVIGTQWLGRIGVVAVIIGVAFFLKYSFDNNLIGQAGRVMLGIVSGAAFLALGEVLHRKPHLARYGELLGGGGLAVLYLSFYAAYVLFHLIPLPLVATGIVAVTTTGMLLSLRYSAYSLSAIALLGGILTPFMLSTGKNNPVELFGYILLLDAATLLLLRYRHWPSLAGLSLLGTALVYAFWHYSFYTPEQQPLAFGAAAALYCCYNLYIVAFRLPLKPEEESKADVLVVFGSAALFFLAFFAQQQFAFTWPLKFFTLTLAGIETGFALFVRRVSKEIRLTAVSYAAVSVAMTVLATFIAFEQRWALPALAVEMALLGWSWFRLDLPVFRWWVYLLGFILLLRFPGDLMLSPEPFERFMPIFNFRFLSCSVVVAGFYALLQAGAQYRKLLSANERYVFLIIFLITQALSLLLIAVEMHDFFYLLPQESVASDYAYQVSLSVFFALYASILTGAGIFRRIRKARITGIALLGATVLKVFFLDLSFLQPVYRIVSFIVLGLLLLIVSYGYNRFRHIIFGEDQT
ncbi:MAG: DUF2339 domain-containing protein [Chlorobium sp.]|jgi:uncharacterized membrane protein|uniref:DUF2339 domain-containing protein n=1 Tax=Chlorobium sp. TaxID=1095 RepID=UPI001DADACA6|nr:DUF2339 domain-containing protein [Chlorobium sp.]MBN1278869.1 DUF2339 domain-containing protein [Chlorobiaceae bacterium]MCF8216013.1 DUF2339 domain-containing protein [Chlorobium sp.]MCF8270914.1 DUF2339 domain-containing protein [Chlorobium sp.]MCF8287288.1 DUF2339 domain-containing protein [Chlorobium sp.]MCF8291663.1 DUF2339 domain-containing protein [Chlorobium sp.]